MLHYEIPNPTGDIQISHFKLSVGQVNPSCRNAQAGGSAMSSFLCQGIGASSRLRQLAGRATQPWRISFCAVSSPCAVTPGTSAAGLALTPWAVRCYMQDKRPLS